MWLREFCGTRSHTRDSRLHSQVMNQGLFDALHVAASEELGPGVVLLRGFALPVAGELRQAIADVSSSAPFRHLVVPSGHTMWMAMTNCGNVGWVSDRRGYRYEGNDPKTGRAWPGMPERFLTLAQGAADAAGFAGFAPNACLINCYTVGAKLSLHQDRDENNYDQPIVSVSLGLAATFLLGGLKRADRTRRVPVGHGDVLVWGGPARMVFHGVLPVKAGSHPFMGEVRVNLTFRSARVG